MAAAPAEAVEAAEAEVVEDGRNEKQEFRIKNSEVRIQSVLVLSCNNIF